MKLNIDKRQSPTIWIKQILQSTQDKPNGTVAYHIIGASLEQRFQKIDVPCHPHTRKFDMGKLVYHVTTVPNRETILKCAENLEVGSLPILLVPKPQEYKATALAQDEGINNKISIISIEDFIALKIIGQAAEQKVDFFSILQKIVRIYNRRLAEVETNPSLQIGVR